MSVTIIPVILSGGSGTRLWPLSRRICPKQFLPLVASGTLFQQTLRRLAGLRGDVGAPIIVCNSAHGGIVAEQLRDIGVEPGAIVLEPLGRNTAPAVAVAANLVLERFEAGRGDAGRSRDEPLLLVLPADHVIRDVDAFVRAVSYAVEAAESGRLVTFGIVPQRPETGYGYIRRGESRGDWALLDEFVEKPDLETATRYVESGEYFWNSGMFLFSSRRFLDELAVHAGDIAESVAAAMLESADVDGRIQLGDAFAACRSESIDYAVMEKTRDAAVVALDAGWSDVGSWPALHEVSDRDRQGNSSSGDVELRSCANSYVVSTSRKLIAIGLDNIVAIETEDAVLIMSADQAQALKGAVEPLDEDLK